MVQDGKYESLNDESQPAIFWPRAQRYDSAMTIVARSSMPPADVLQRIQQAVYSLDSTLPFFQADSLEDHLSLPLLPARMAAIMLGGFGVLAVILAATGVYGMLATRWRSVRGRSEFGWPSARADAMYFRWCCGAPC